MSKEIENFRTIGLSKVPYPSGLRLAVEEAVEAWKKVCGLPEEIRSLFPYNSEEGMGVGYEIKKTAGASLDIKEDFHFTQGSKEWIQGKAQEIGNPVITEFVEKVNHLIDLMKPVVVSFAREVETLYAINDFADEVERSSDIWFVRFLHYFGGTQEGEEIAKAHADKSGFTLHLYESDSGLQYLDRKYNWQDMPVSESETVIIPGMRGQYRSGGKLKATFHRVVATSETAKTGRYSAVAFIHLKDTPAYNKAQSGRLQEFKPGFNYEMPLEEFSRLFSG